jgi:hypothetical protein
VALEEERRAEQAQDIRNRHELQREVLAELAAAADLPPAKRSPRTSGETGFISGERVVHPRFGSGAVVTRSATGNHNEKVTVAFDTGETKTLLTAYAGLTRERSDQVAPSQPRGAPR